MLIGKIDRVDELSGSELRITISYVESSSYQCYSVFTKRKQKKLMDLFKVTTIKKLVGCYCEVYRTREVNPMINGLALLKPDIEWNDEITEFRS